MKLVLEGRTHEGHGVKSGMDYLAINMNYPFVDDLLNKMDQSKSFAEKTEDNFAHMSYRRRDGVWFGQGVPSDNKAPDNFWENFEALYDHFKEQTIVETFFDFYPAVTDDFGIPDSAKARLGLQTIKVGEDWFQYNASPKHSEVTVVTPRIERDQLLSMRKLLNKPVKQ